MKTVDFFSASNQSLLSDLKKALKTESKDEDKEEASTGESDAELEKKKGIIQDEEKGDGARVDYKVCIDYFRFCTTKLGGKWSVLIVLFLHILINIATASMSFYLAFTLSDYNDKVFARRPKGIIYSHK